MIHALCVHPQVTFQYIANIRLPTEKAHGAQIMKTCEALARKGATVELIVSTRHTPITEDPFVYYGVEKNFSIVRVPTLDLIFLGRIGFLLESLLFGISALWHVRKSSAVLYSRDELPLSIISLFKKRVVWEVHDRRANVCVRRLLRVCTRVVVITEGLCKLYSTQTYAEILVAPDGIDLRAFNNPESKEVARARLGLPLDKKVALYIGRLDGWKGTKTLFEAVAFLSDAICVAVMGGEEAQVKELRAKYPRVQFLGFRPYRELRDNQAAADVLVLPNTGKDEISAQFTSPMKLFSYMAARRPIVASDLPSLREVLSEDSAVFFTADDARSLAGAIESVLSNPIQAAAHAEKAYADVGRYTWEERAAAMLSFVVAV